MSKKHKATRQFRLPVASVNNFRPAQSSLAIYADGGCEFNPGGDGGWAFVVYRCEIEIAHDFGGEPITTNNRMELQALIEALEWVAQNAFAEPVTIWSDSRYTVDGSMSWRHRWRAKGWKKKGPGELANLDQWQIIDTLLTRLPLTQVAWCKGHAGIVGNVRADELASAGRASNDVSDRGLSTLDNEYRSIMGAFA